MNIIDYKQYMDEEKKDGKDDTFDPDNELMLKNRKKLLALLDQSSDPGIRRDDNCSCWHFW